LIPSFNIRQLELKMLHQDKELDEAFNTSVTNLAEWREEGLLGLRRHVDPNGSRHSCLYGCGPNLCKGTKLEAYLKDRE
jgi:hypothetical protein